MIAEWLQKQTTVLQVEQDYMVKDERLGPASVPFGFQNDEWTRLKGLMRTNDELWTFTSPEESWQNLAGRAGICIVRDGVIVDSIVTEMN